MSGQAMNVMCLYPYARLHLGGAGRPSFLLDSCPAVGSFLPFLSSRESREVSSDFITVIVHGQGVSLLEELP